MHYLVPQFIIDNYHEGEQHGRFFAICLFADISGFSTITDSLMKHGPHGAETLAGLMRNVFTPLIGSVYEYGGFVPTLAGDAFTAVFPVDNDSESERQDAAMRATAAAWHIQQRMKEVQLQATPYGDFTISAKVGAACGDVGWGIITSEDDRRATYYFEGEAVDGSARAEHAAKPGEIICTDPLYAYAGSLVAAEALPDDGDLYRMLAIGDDVPAGKPADRQPVDADTMSHFFPREIVNQELSGEFRQVLSLFISLPTVRTEDQLAIFMRSVFALQDKYGGLLIRVDFGDKGSNLLLFWGAPVSYENDVNRALNFVLDLQTNTSIPINAGVTYRIAHAGFVGSPLREEYTCYGRGVNLAARFMTAAARGEIWLDEHTARLAEPHFDIEFEGEMAFKGFAEKQKVYVLFEAREESEISYERAMVGRQEEMAALTEFIQPLLRGRPAGTMIIWGDPGVGKSRLAHEFGHCDIIEEAGVLWALCQSDEILRESFNPFRYWLRRYFDQSEAQSEPRNKRNFNRMLDGLIDDITDDGLAAELDRTRSFLAAMLDLYWPDSLYAGLDASGRYENTMLGLLALMKAESQRQPLIIHLEDMHLIDEASRELVVRLADALRPSDGETYPIALIATARREGSGFPLTKDDMFWEMDLSQLSRESLRDLAQDMLGGTVAESLLDVIESQAEGNPFFVEQILRYLIESDLLTEGANGWQVRQEQRRLLPEDVRSVLVARLDRLAQEVKAVVQTAAVLGREFEVMLLISMLRDEPATRQKITAAEEAAIWSALSQLRYIFKHALLRDTAYRMQVRVRRQLLHKLAADAIEILYEEDLSAHYGELGYHSERAGLLEAASDWYMLAANQALNRGTLLDARSYLERAEALIPTSDLDRRWTVHSRQVEILSALGDAEACLEAATSALAVAQELDDKALIARAYLARGSTAHNIGDDPSALIAFESGLEAARQSGAQSVEAIILSMKTLTLARMGRMEDASIAAEGALLMAEESGNEGALVRTLNNLANFNMFLSDYGRSAEFLARQIKINRRQTDRVGEVHGLTNLAYNLLAGGRYEAAREAIEQALQLSMSMGALRLTAYNRLNLGLAWTRLDQPAKALLELETAQQLLSSIDDKFAGAVSHTYMGLALEVDGQTDQAAEAFELAAEMMGDIGARGYAMDAASGCGRCALLSEDNSRAAELAGEVWTYLREAGASGLEFPMLAYESCAQVFERTGNLEGYRAAVETGYGDLMSRAQKISDDAWRSSYLHNVPENRVLVDRWEQLTE